MFEPQLFQPAAPVAPAPDPAAFPQDPVAAAAGQPALPAPQVIPVPIFLSQPKPPKPPTWPAAMVRKAQALYPKEAAEKAARMEAAKTPTPTGAWGAPR